MLTNGGEYNPETAYEQLTMVMYENSTYITLKTVQGITPTDDHINYQLMAKGFNPTALESVQAEDTSGVLGEVGGTVSAQDLINWVVDQAATKLLKISDLVSVQTNDATKGVSAALAYAMGQKLDQLNSNLKTPVIGNPTFDSSYFTDKGTQIKKIGTTVTVKIVGTIKFDAMTSFATNKIMDIPEGFRPIWSIGEYHILGKNVTDLIMIESTSIGINKQFSSGNQNVEFSIIYLTSE
jgi:hypothetical protein